VRYINIYFDTSNPEKMILPITYMSHGRYGYLIDVQTENQNEKIIKLKTNSQIYYNSHVNGNLIILYHRGLFNDPWVEAIE
jgi:hypothetical protein